MPWSSMVLVENGKNEDGTPKMKEIEVVDIDKLRVVESASKTVLTTLGKDEGYSTKTEVKGTMQGEIKINSVNYADTPLEVEAQVVDKTIEMVEQKILDTVIVEKI
jgi:hypothetical protein